MVYAQRTWRTHSYVAFRVLIMRPDISNVFQAGPVNALKLTSIGCEAQISHQPIIGMNHE